MTEGVKTNAGVALPPDLPKERYTVRTTSLLLLLGRDPAYGTDYGVGRVSVTSKCRGLYTLHHGNFTAVGGRFLYARHPENVVFDLGRLPLRP